VLCAFSPCLSTLPSDVGRRVIRAVRGGTRELRERLGGRSADAEEPSRVEERTVSDEPDTDEGGAMLLAETGYSFPRV
jgi:hypothetical protein